MDDTKLQDFMDEIHYLFHPEPDEDGIIPREYPNARLKDFHRLNFDYMESFDWEGASIHKYTRLCPEDESRIHTLIRNQDVPDRLFSTALHLFADSIIEYHQKKGKKGELRFYPPIILTFWSAFETFVRYSSELLIVTFSDLPKDVIQYLKEEENYLDRKGDIKIKTKYQSVLDRYSVFLKYAYGYEVDRGSLFWQQLQNARKLRDYYTHLDISEPREISSNDVISYLEAVLLGIIIPSSHLQRTLMLGVYWLYEIWSALFEYRVEYTERPFFMDWHLKKRYLFHCNFENVNKERFPNMQEDMNKRESI
ncbi:MAG: hypothetical protein KAX28_00650 [Candidatus Marinimicrobia bacterium]|nr:hypothetical protein [Candidatus Neomarinimicrobiota bacterium]